MVCIFITGPGVEDPETGTMKYLEKVAVDTARALANETLTVPPIQSSWTNSECAM